MKKVLAMGFLAMISTAQNDITKAHISSMGMDQSAQNPRIVSVTSTGNSIQHAPSTDAYSTKTYQTQQEPPVSKVSQYTPVKVEGGVINEDNSRTKQILERPKATTTSELIETQAQKVIQRPQQAQVQQVQIQNLQRPQIQILRRPKPVVEKVLVNPQAQQPVQAQDQQQPQVTTKMPQKPSQQVQTIIPQRAAKTGGPIRQINRYGYSARQPLIQKELLAKPALIELPQDKLQRIQSAKRQIQLVEHLHENEESDGPEIKSDYEIENDDQVQPLTAPKTEVTYNLGDDTTQYKQDSAEPQNKQQVEEKSPDDANEDQGLGFNNPDLFGKPNLRQQSGDDSQSKGDSLGNVIISQNSDRPNLEIAPQQDKQDFENYVTSVIDRYASNSAVPNMITSQSDKPNLELPPLPQSEQGLDMTSLIDKYGGNSAPNVITSQSDKPNLQLPSINYGSGYTPDYIPSFTPSYVPDNTPESQDQSGNQNDYLGNYINQVIKDYKKNPAPNTIISSDSDKPNLEIPLNSKANDVKTPTQISAPKHAVDMRVDNQQLQQQRNDYVNVPQNTDSQATNTDSQVPTTLEPMKPPTDADYVEDDSQQQTDVQYLNSPQYAPKKVAEDTIAVPVTSKDKKKPKYSITPQKINQEATLLPAEAGTLATYSDANQVSTDNYPDLASFK